MVTLVIGIVIGVVFKDHIMRVVNKIRSVVGV